MKTRAILTAAAMLASAVATAPSMASAFFAWEVTDVPWGDVLNVRKYPAVYSQKQAAYPNGTVLSMTGRCTKDLHMDQIDGLPYWQQRQAVRYRWCEIWHDPANDGNFVTGWVYGRYVRPHTGQ